MARRLTSRQREFFTLLSHAVFANPFGEERERIDLSIANAGARRTPQRGDVVDQMLLVVGREIAQLGPAPLDVRHFDGDDRYVLELAILFEVFHRFGPSFDALIQGQLGRRGKPARVPFAREALRALDDHGFEREDACLRFAMCYQLRRAFYFIQHSLAGNSASMRLLRESLWNNVFTHDIRLYARLLWRKMEDFSTFLLGETGSGKGAAAAAIGRSGFIPFDPKTESFTENFGDAFLAINLSQYPETLLESELFGHRKGAFTGAVDAHDGIFQRCSPHGAIFLDEIGDASEAVQIKLLRVLQERLFSPVGSHEPARFEGRVIAATNRSIAGLRRAGTFRDDFYYRLCSDVIHVPTLRQRIEEDDGELDLLLSTILVRIAGEDSEELRETVRHAIDENLGKGYAWPGNVRELEQCVRRVLLTRRCAMDDRLPSADDAGALLLGATNDGAYGADELLAMYCRALYARHKSYEEVARRTKLDRRTVKKYVTV